MFRRSTGFLSAMRHFARASRFLSGRSGLQLFSQLAWRTASRGRSSANRNRFQHPATSVRSAAHRRSSTKSLCPHPAVACPPRNTLRPALPNYSGRCGSSRYRVVPWKRSRLAPRRVVVTRDVAARRESPHPAPHLAPISGAAQASTAKPFRGHRLMECRTQ